MEKLKVAIIGGGSSGLFAANLLSTDKLDVYILEKNSKLGKKILASGNGKCNLTNLNIKEENYNNKLGKEIIDKYDVKKTLNQFRKRGLIYKFDDEGRCYPASETANSVLDVLKEGLKKAHIYLDCEVTNIKKEGNKYSIKFGKYKELFDYVICCSGSNASNLGSMKAYNYLENLKIKINNLRPSLTPVIVRENIKSLKGVRIKCLAKLIDDNKNIIYSEKGEILFKEDSLSGIAIFNISSYINRKKDNQYKIVLDLSNEMEKEEIFNYFSLKKNTKNIFKGFLNDKISEYILNELKIEDETLTEKTKEKLYKFVTNLEFTVKDLYPLIDSQVCSGGISLKEVNESLELNSYPNIYIAGELLDIDGICGGYNLQFAWSSAGVISEEILRKTGENSGNKK